MESSFSEYRHSTVVSDSDCEFIDGSGDESKNLRKKSLRNQSRFVAESDTEDDTEEYDLGFTNTVQSSIPEPTIGRHSSSKDDKTERDSTHQETHFRNVVISSSEDEGQGSPEMVPKRRPPVNTKTVDSPPISLIGRKVKKRIMVLDSDTDNSIVIEHEKHKKQMCSKDTPLKISSGKTANQKANNSLTNDEADESSDDVSTSEGESENYSDEDGPDEDQMVMSRATRMSIMGVIPKDNNYSDESDFIQSDEINIVNSPRKKKPLKILKKLKSSVKSRRDSFGSANSLAELPEVTNTGENIPQNELQQSPIKLPKVSLETSNIIHDLTCSPFSSPLKDITNEFNNSTQNVSKNIDDIQISPKHEKENDDNKQALKQKVLNRIQAEFRKPIKKNIPTEGDDDVTIVEKVPEIIALSSDDEVVEVKKSPKPRKSKSLRAKSPSLDSQASTNNRNQDNTIKQYMVPASYPNQIVYVKDHVKENEERKFQSLRDELANVRKLLEHMEVESLPDGGSKLMERLHVLETKVREQGDKLANMVVDPELDQNGDSTQKGLTWEDIKKASNAVQPRMFGKHAMATHMAERNHILQRLRDLHESLGSRPPESARAAPPRGLAATLMPHQLQALAWLRWRETQRPPGGILADDMGLGKTITIISLVLSDKENRIGDEDDDEDEYGRGGTKGVVRGGTLVVCPASLIQQWGNEVNKHCVAHSLTVCLHHGAARTQHAARLATYDIVVTTYNILQRDNEKGGVVSRVSWRRAVLDEAHIVRNYKSATSAAASALRAARRWALSGTPVHNRDLDMFALLKFLRCSPFDDLLMWKKWIDNKSQGGQERLSTIMQCIVLRRTKLQLQQKGQLDCLPDRLAHQVQVTLTKDEMNVYQKVLVLSKTLFAQFLYQRAEKQADFQGFGAAGNETAYDKMHKKMITLQGAKPVKSHQILVLLLRLRQVCCHCGLIAAMLDDDDRAQVHEDPAGQDLLAELNKLTIEDANNQRKSIQKEEDEEQQEEGTTVAEAIRSVLSPNNPVFNLQKQSSKIKEVMKCLKENVFVNKGEKAVVVSQWTSVLSLVERELKAARVGCVTLSGAVPVPARQHLVDQLNRPGSGVTVMLLSLCAGGVGLNLCGANHLLLLDPHWNPQLEQQAQDRVYRVGQARAVHVYRFMCVDTVEQSIRKLQDAKLQLAENVLTGAKNTNASKLTIEDLKMLFNMGQ